MAGIGASVLTVFTSHRVGQTGEYRGSDYTRQGCYIAALQEQTFRFRIMSLAVGMTRTGQVHKL
jgi:hypothetical protein